jgi:phenylalanyl-tRNA synthetase beta chain
MLLENCVRILNPISRDLDIMRQSLLFGCLESVINNINRRSADLKFYEFGTVYRKAEGPGDPVNGYHEETHMAMLLTGRSSAENWNSGNSEVNWFELNGYLQAMLRKLGIIPVTGNNGSKISREPVSGYIYSSGIRYLFRDKYIGTAGLLSKAVLKTFDIRQEVYYAELNWTEILSLIPSKETRYHELPKFPEVRRDLALLLDDAVKFEDIERLAYQTEKKILKHVGLFDVYEGEQLGKGKKSYALSFTLRDDEKTLTDKEIDKCMDRLISAFGNNLKAQVR